MEGGVKKEKMYNWGQGEKTHGPRKKPADVKTKENNGKHHQG